MFLSVILFGIVVILAAIPFAIGVFQARTGIRLLMGRTQPGLAAFAAAFFGLFLGLLHLPGSTFNPGIDSATDAWRLVLGLVLIGTNLAAIWLAMSEPIARRAQ